MSPRKILCVGLATMSLAACSTPGGQSSAPSDAPATARDLISGDSVRAGVRELGSDTYQGRAPGTRGDTLATAWIAAQMKQLGLEPGMPDGSYRQTAPFWAAAAKFTIILKAGGKEVVLNDSSTAVVWESAPAKEIALDDKELVFAGFGINAPEVGWRDYKTPVAGRIVMALYGEPTRPDTTFFLGRELGWYGWIMHKEEEAGAQGAAALLLVVDEQASGIPWSALQSYARERSHLKAEARYPKQVPNVFFVNRKAADRILALSGRTFADAVTAAGDSAFSPVGLKASASIRITQRIREFGSDNVVARITGSDPALRNQAVIYSAHWDHMGIDTTLKGDQIYNGAIDNAVGVASLLELARAFKAAPKPPKRTVLFVATTAEEQLLLGAQYYVYHPVVPLDSTVADLDLDGVNVWGRANSVSAMGMEETGLGELLGELSRARGRVVKPNPMLVAGGRYRTDRFAFARVGVPGIIYQGSDLAGKTPAEEQRLAGDYLATRYHQVTDSVRSDWDFAGAEDDLRLFFELGWRLADGAPRPQWKTGLRHTLMFGKPLAPTP